MAASLMSDCSGVASAQVPFVFLPACARKRVSTIHQAELGDHVQMDRLAHNLLQQNPGKPSGASVEKKPVDGVGAPAPEHPSPSAVEGRSGALNPAVADFLDSLDTPAVAAAADRVAIAAQVHAAVAAAIAAVLPADSRLHFVLGGRYLDAEVTQWDGELKLVIYYSLS